MWAWYKHKEMWRGCALAPNIHFMSSSLCKYAMCSAPPRGSPVCVMLCRHACFDLKAYHMYAVVCIESSYVSAFLLDLALTLQHAVLWSLYTVIKLSVYLHSWPHTLLFLCCAKAEH